MFSTKFAALAFIASAAAYTTGGPPASVPKLGQAKAWRPPLAGTTDPNFAKKPQMKAKEMAPVITIFDARGGCSRPGIEYMGAKDNTDDANNKMCLKVQNTKIVAGNADAVLANVLGQITE
jgi:hypothetical protein